MVEQIPPTVEEVSPEREEAPREGAPPEGMVHGAGGPRFRRTVRTAAIAGALLFFALLAVLSSRYSRGVEPAAAGEAARPPAASRPLSAERIERYARELLAEERRARERPPGPPDLGLAPAEPAAGGAGLALAPPPAPVPSTGHRQQGSGRRLSAIRSGLIPAGGGASPRDRGPGGAGAVPGSVGPGREAGLAGGPVLPELGELRRTLAGLADAPGGPAAAQAGRSPGQSEARTVTLPETGVERLTRLPAPAVPDRIYAGTVVPLVLAHDVATDVPGPVRAFVARDVYDSLSHRRLLVPRGALVIGHQAAYAAGGDERVLIAWQELKLLSGETLLLPGPPAGSRDGSAGVRGRVDRHWWSRFGSAAALSLVGAGAQLAQPQRRSAVDGFAPSEGQVLAQQLGLELGRLSQEILRRGVDRPPTITLRAGQPLSLLVTTELAFPR